MTLATQRCEFAMGLTLGSILLSTTTKCLAAADANFDVNEKQWYLRKIVVADTELPVSYATVVVLFYILYYFMGCFRRKGPLKPVTYCRASHILLKDHGDETAQLMLKYRNKIGNDPELFIKHAKKYSACPSSYRNGSLGKFTPGSMDPLFEQVCFDPNAPLHTVLGPVHTRFGYHLIWIEERHLVKRA